MLRSKGIAAQVHYIPVTSQPYYKNRGYRTSEFRNAQKFYKNAISLPLFPAMSDEDVRYVIKTVTDILCQKRAR
jgi:dTDP-4-amino-4,6-dideoxygalactose transaminase